MAYLNIIEVDSAILNLAAAYPSICELISLPSLSKENVVSHAIRIGKFTGKDTVFITGGVHAREWGSCEICINTAADILEAYMLNTGLVYGGKTFTASAIKNIVDGLNIILFPLVNPDGRKYSQETAAMWRGNRNTTDSGNNPVCFGVDINRNFDFLWDFPNLFDPAASVHTSTNPCSSSQTFRGSGAFSEAETSNVRWVMENFPVKWYIDLHSSGEDILFSWGDDENQSVDGSMNFLNPAYNTKRGKSGDAAYKEYLPAPDSNVSLQLANAMHDAIADVRGKNYSVRSAFDLYPTSGASDDYAFSRSFSNPADNKIISYTIEWGQEFQPVWSEMENIIADISAALICFAVKAPCVSGIQDISDPSDLLFTDIPEGETTVRAISFVADNPKTFQ